MKLWSLWSGSFVVWEFWGFVVLRWHSTASWLYVKPGVLEVWHGVGSWSFGIVVLWSFGVWEFGSFVFLEFWGFGALMLEQFAIVRVWDLGCWV
jgi:hypothetical protein